jgi:hypothetical protein
LAITTGSFPSITATHEFVVPKSIPMTFAMTSSSQEMNAHTAHRVGTELEGVIAICVPSQVIPHNIM